MNKAQFEDILRKAVYRIGKFTERLIEESSKISSPLATKPILALEGQVQISKLKEIIESEANKIFTSSMPSLIDKTALEICEHGSKLADKFKEKGASLSVHVDMDTGPGTYETAKKDIISCKSSANRLPFEDSFFDQIYANLASQRQKELALSIHEMGRVLTLGGEAIICDFHPFGSFARKGTARLRPIESSAAGFEDYYKFCSQASLKIDHVKEIFVDDNLKTYFKTDEEKAAFRMVKDSPLLIFIFVKKGTI